MDLTLLQQLNDERRARRPAILVTDTANGAQRLVRGADIAGDPLAEALEAALRAGKSRTLEVDGRGLFLNVQAPPPRLFLIGAVHVAQALAPMARLCDLDVTIIDPRTAFATPARFPDAAVVAEWPDEALARLGIDAYTAIVCLTHDPKVDDPALEAALGARCFYVGALGSRKTHGRRLERLAAKGFGAADFARIHAPIGLDIGAVSPAEIAVSILAEIIAGLRRKPPRAEKAA